MYSGEGTTDRSSGGSMKVLLVRPDGIGDEILCLPVASALRQSLPDVRIVFLSSRYAAPLFEHHPDVDEVWSLTGKESLAELVGFFKQGIDAAVFLKPFRRLMWAAWLARVPRRIATGYRWYSVCANRRVYQHRKDFSKHETEYNVDLLAGLGLTPSSVQPPKLVLTEEERQQAKDRLHAVRTPRVVLHPGGFAARRWRVEHYGALASVLKHEGVGVVLTGSQAEGEQFSQSVLSAMPDASGLCNLMGELSVRELMAVIAESNAIVSGATGPAHIAAALGVPNVSLFDPRRNNLPTRWQPLGKGVVLRPEVPTCEKCSFEACPYWDCLDRLTVETVARHVGGVIKAASPIKVIHV